MFGYARPLKGDLLVREFTWYRAVYCGICKSLGSRYGQFSRLGVNYDATLLGVLLFSLRPEAPGEVAESCIANPLRKHPVARPDPVLDACADMTVMLAWHKAKDDTADGFALRGLAARAVYSSARRRAAAVWPEMDRAASEGMASLAKVESSPPGEDAPMLAAAAFGSVTGGIFGAAADRLLPGLDPAFRDALRLAGDRIGRWIYLIDAIDDRSDDADNENWNPFAGLDAQAAAGKAGEMLEALEAEIDRTLALLPYERDAAIVSNIVQAGLPAVRADVLAGRKLGRL